ncbi:hypothetical protein F5Y15DRAFT_384534 [Xylariaceae sp. FL0016]|nr:hypothetical protein F5Y15DRAFT_384534 [Xylariaceae sp. FL0016]
MHQSIRSLVEKIRPHKDTGWRPRMMRMPALAALAILTLTIAAVIEILARKAAEDGALSLSRTENDIPQAMVLLSTYLPTALLVFYSLVWAWVDLDVKRFQPWLQLSRSEGSCSQDSLLLDYLADFVLFVPFKAARRRHWPVFFVGMAMLALLLITPLSSSVFGVGSVQIAKAVSSASYSLLSLSDQAVSFDVSVLNSAFASIWLGQGYPSSMTKDYALLPFQTDQQPSYATDSYLRSSTWQLTTDLECWPAQVNTSGPYYSFDNGLGCNVDIALGGSPFVPHNRSYAILYVGYFSNARLDYYLEGVSCSTNSSHQFLAIWAAQNASTSPYTSVTGQFCEPRYYKRRVSVSLSTSTLRPNESSIMHEGDLQPLEDSEFNRTAFEYLIGTGQSSRDILRDYPGDAPLEQSSQIAASFSATQWPATPMVGFGLGSQNYSLAELQDPNKLKAAYSAAHKTIFSMAITRALSSNVENTTQTGSLHFTAYGILLSGSIATAVEVLLLLMAVLTVCTLFQCRRSTSLLMRNPTSIGMTLGMLHCSKDVLDDFMDQDVSTSTSLESHLRGRAYALRRQEDSDRLLSLHRIEKRNPEGHGDTGLDVEPSKFSPTLPLELKTLSGICCIGMLTTGLVTLVYFKQQEPHARGFPQPIPDFEMMQLLENSAPVLFATLLGPLWLLLNRTYCLLQPFSELQRGQSDPRRSILTEYTSLPPQLVFWRSARAKHYLLMLICSATILADVLAVAMGGIFFERPVRLNDAISVSPTRSPVTSRDEIVPSLTPTKYSDHYEILLTNLSTGTSLPSWTDDNFFYLPFDNHPNGSLGEGELLTAHTRGFGVDVECSPLYTNDTSTNKTFYYSAAGPAETFSWSLKESNGSIIECKDFYGSLTPDLDDVVSRSAREFILSLSGWNPSQCAAIPDFLVGWARLTPVKNESERVVHKAFLSCLPRVRTAMFDVTVDSDGNIVKANMSGSFDAVQEFIPAEEIKNIARLMGKYHANEQTAFDNVWHNETITRDWFNHLLTLTMQSRSLVNVTLDVPDAEAMIPAVQDLYRRLSAIVFGLNPDFFRLANGTLDANATLKRTETQDNNTTKVNATLMWTETRIFVSNPASNISIAIMCFYIVIAVAVYWRGRHFLLPRMPSTLGSLLAYTAPSHTLEEFAVYTARDPKRGAGSSGKTYTFGDYIGVDGKPHVGIESGPFVQPLNKRRLKGEILDKNETTSKDEKRGVRFIRTTNIVNHADP